MKKEEKEEKKNINVEKKSNIIDKLKERIRNKDKESFNLNEVIIIMLFSFCIGIVLCFSLFSILVGKNYFKVIHDLDKVIDTYYAIVDN